MGYSEWFLYLVLLYCLIRRKDEYHYEYITIYYFSLLYSLHLMGTGNYLLSDLVFYNLKEVSQHSICCARLVLKYLLLHLKLYPCHDYNRLPHNHEWLLTNLVCMGYCKHNRDSTIVRLLTIYSMPYLPNQKSLPHLHYWHQAKTYM